MSFSTVHFPVWVLGHEHAKVRISVECGCNFIWMCLLTLSMTVIHAIP